MNCTNPDIFYFFLAVFVVAMAIPLYFFYLGVKR
jgi:hypothetical protein